MLEASRTEILATLDDSASVLDVGGWAHPLSRADWVIDLMPYETRGLYGEPDPDPERFDSESWVTRDICDHRPWPFEDDQFDFVVCSHTLEDVRDPIWVCAEINRVGKAGYIEVPARIQEQTRGVHGPWVGWSHHHWLIDIEGMEVRFVFKPHLLHGRPEFWVDPSYTERLAPADLVSRLFWQESFDFAELVFLDSEELHEYLRGPLERAGLPAPTGKRSLIRRARGALSRAG